MPADMEPEIAEVRARLGITVVQQGTWAGDSDIFRDVDGKKVKDKDDVLLTRLVPVSSGARWVGGDAQPGCRATVLLFSTGERSIAHLECYCEPDGFVFGWEETSRLKLYKTTEEKWPD